MSLLERISSVFSRTRQDGRAPRRAAGRTRRTIPVSEPVSVEPPREHEPPTPAPGHAEGEQESTVNAALATRRSKQEMISELKRNYDEVLTLVRKLDTRIDQQEERSERMLAIAEKLPQSLEALPRIHEQNERAIDALDQLVNLARTGEARDDEARRTLEAMRERVETTRESQLELVGAMATFRESMHDMSESSTRVSRTLAEMNEQSAARERELADLVASSQKWTLAAVIACGVVAVAAGVITLVAIFG